MTISKKILFSIFFLILLFTILIPFPEIGLTVWFTINVLFSVGIFIVSCLPKKFLNNDSLYIFFATSFLFTVAVSRKIMEMAIEGFDENLFLKLSDSLCFNNPILECLIILMLGFCTIFFLLKIKSRNSEILARYMIESLPAKICEVENTLRANKITIEEAEQRKKEIRSEEDYYSRKECITKLFLINCIVLFTVILLVFISVFFIIHYLGISNFDAFKYASSYFFSLSIILVVMQIFAFIPICKF